MKMIVCVSENYGIGNGGKLLFSLPPDMKFFRETTLGKCVIMGRSTLESFPGKKPLKNRENIVLSRSADFKCDGAVVFNTVEAAAEYADFRFKEDAFVIGGAQIYKEFEPYCNEALVTKVYKTQEADAFFFNIDSSPNWILMEDSGVLEYEDLKYAFLKYVRK